MEVSVFRFEDGRSPFEDWLRSLSDGKSRQRIEVRLARIRNGNLGDHRALGNGVSELRMHFGAGYRVYFGRIGESVVLLLCGGDKGSQDEDIDLAKDYWRQYKEIHGG